MDINKINTALEKGKNILSSIEKYLRNKNLALFLFFLVLSFTLWFLNSLRKSYSTTLSCPVYFENLPEDKMVLKDISSDIKIKVKGTGFVLLRYKFTNSLSPITFDFRRMRRFSNGQMRGGYLLTENYEQYISSNLNKDLELEDISPDTLMIGLMNRKTKVVPIRIDAKISYQESFHQSAAVTIEPDSISISGPEMIVDTTNSILTELQSFETINDTVIKKVKLNVPDWASSDVSEASIVIPVESFTESRLRIPIVVKNIPQNISVKTFPADIDLTCLVAISQFENVNADKFTAVVDLQGLDLEKQKRLKVKIETSPKFVYSIKYEPIFVDFLLERSY